jgi:hypothetical protein
MAHPYDKKAAGTPHPMNSKVQTNQQRADARYGALKTPDLRAGPLIASAQRTAMPEESFTGAPSRQVSDFGKVRK